MNLRARAPLFAAYVETSSPFSGTYLDYAERYRNVSRSRKCSGTCQCAPSIHPTRFQGSRWDTRSGLAPGCRPLHITSGPVRGIMGSVGIWYSFTTRVFCATTCAIDGWLEVVQLGNPKQREAVCGLIHQPKLSQARAGKAQS